YPIKILALASAFEVFLPQGPAILILLALAFALLTRFALWRPGLAFSRFGIAVMYVGYLGIVAHLALAAAMRAGALQTVGDVPTHVFAFVTMGTIIPSMFIRISQGHTGRKILFTTSDRAAIG